MSILGERSITEQEKDKGLARYRGKLDLLADTVMQGDIEKAFKAKELTMRDPSIVDSDKQRISDMLNRRIKLDEAQRNFGVINNPMSLARDY